MKKRAAAHRKHKQGGCIIGGEDYVKTAMKMTMIAGDMTEEVGCLQNGDQLE